MNPKPITPKPPDDEPEAGAIQPPPRTLPPEIDHRDKVPREHPQGERVQQSDSDEDARSRRRDI